MGFKTYMYLKKWRVLDRGGVDMYAVIKTGGKQYKVEEGFTIKVEKLNNEVGDKVNFDEVVLLSNDGDITVGKPVIEGASVSGTVLEQGKNKKVVVYKYKPKKNYSKKRGHRQPYTLVKIDSINA